MCDLFVFIEWLEVILFVGGFFVLELFDFEGFCVVFDVVFIFFVVL